MSVGAWEPDQTAAQDKTQKPIERELLRRYIAAARADKPLGESLETADMQASHLIRLPTQRWLEESEAWDSEQLWQLIRFFTLAEKQLPGWDAGAESAVIPLAKALRRRKTPLDKEQLLWIKQHSDNRYLPYGPL
ncbi:hypothetical protein [Microbulbifer halophilus]|uniref:Uncharacterized protein n=1 Tax=Microbulbifer halophilus TaxID=453963 RepID=A0ABW5EDY3_9GAMM|nr:hypothetical protein [Microbulbifer halophilus]MCW8126489.1 hypothetical protein [Microbulbifer halophilus]